MKNRIRSIIILAITCVLLYLVFRKVGLADLFNTLRQADPLWIVVSLAITPLLILVSVVRWQALLKSQGVRLSIGRLYGLYLVGRFFNYFLPSNVGGDVVRGYELGTQTKDGARAMASVFMERFTGFIMLVAFAVVSSITNYRLLQNTGLEPAVLMAVIILIGILWLILDVRPLNLVARWISFPFAQKYIKKIKKFHASIYAYKGEWRVLTVALLWSFVFMVLAIANVYASAMAFHKPVSLPEIIVVVPVILVVAMFPLTVNGLGLQEWAYVLLFNWIGLPSSVGLSTILLIRSKDIVLSLIGGLIYAYMKVQKREAVPDIPRSEEVFEDHSQETV
jgi:uncharacterized protein (TIRG00374 family)